MFFYYSLPHNVMFFIYFCALFGFHMVFFDEQSRPWQFSGRRPCSGLHSGFGSAHFTKTMRLAST